MLIGGTRPDVGEHLAGGYYFEPTVLKGHNKMRVFQEEIFGPVLAVTTFRDEAEALEIANDTLYGLGAGVWTRDGSLAFTLLCELACSRECERRDANAGDCQCDPHCRQWARHQPRDRQRAQKHAARQGRNRQLNYRAAGPRKRHTREAGSGDAAQPLSRELRRWKLRKTFLAEGCPASPA